MDVASKSAFAIYAMLRTVVLREILLTPVSPDLSLFYTSKIGVMSPKIVGE